MNLPSPYLQPPCRVLLFTVIISLALLAIGCGGKKQTAHKVPPAPSLDHFDRNAKVLWTEVGYACWYGPNFHKKKAANGELYDQNEMTAAHKTLPLNSIVRVVNLTSHKAAVVRITDRGPFARGRIIDLSAAAAKAVDVYIPGTVRVRLEVLETSHPIKRDRR